MESILSWKSLFSSAQKCLFLTVNCLISNLKLVWENVLNVFYLETPLYCRHAKPGEASERCYCTRAAKNPPTLEENPHCGGGHIQVYTIIFVFLLHLCIVITLTLTLTHTHTHTHYFPVKHWDTFIRYVNQFQQMRLQCKMKSLQWLFLMLQSPD